VEDEGVEEGSSTVVSQFDLFFHFISHGHSYGIYNCYWVEKARASGLPSQGEASLYFAFCSLGLFRERHPVEIQAERSE
jgi:hypothetical protein